MPAGKLDAVQVMNETLFFGAPLSLSTFALASLLIVVVWWLLRWVPGAPVPGLPFQPRLHKPIIGCAAELQETIGGLKKLCVDNANDDGISSFRLISTPVVSVLKAEHARKVLLASNYRHEPSLINKPLAAFLGNKALVMLMHDEWKAHRYVISRAFHFQHLKGMVGDMVEVADALAQRIVDPKNSLSTRGVNMFSSLKLATLDIIGLTAFGYRFNTVKTGSHPVVDAFEWLLDETTRRQFKAPLSPEVMCTALPTANNRRFSKESRVLRSCIDGIVASRIAEGSANDHEDLLKYMLEARSEGQAEGVGADKKMSITDEALTDNLLTLLFGGFDTTSIALAYTLYSVAQHPDVEALALAEILRVVGPVRSMTYEHVGELKYCQAVITEALRLYPPAPLTVRTLEQPMRLTEGGPLLPEGTMMCLPLWWIHRSELNWGLDAALFRPERHLESTEGIKTKSSFRMIAFSGGQRNCPGQRFAMLEATVLFATLIRTATFTVAEESANLLPVSSGVVQKPKSGELWMHVKARK